MEVPLAHHALTGFISVEPNSPQSLEDFCRQYIYNYNPDRFELIAIRLFAGKETIVTVYALDKFRQEGSTYHEGKIPVKKFKLESVSVEALFRFFKEFNFTLSPGNYDIEDMEVINR